MSEISPLWMQLLILQVLISLHFSWDDNAKRHSETHLAYLYTQKDSED